MVLRLGHVTQGLVYVIPVLCRALTMHTGICRVLWSTETKYECTDNKKTTNSATKAF